MRICMVTSELPPRSGGVGYYVYNLSKKLVERGHQVTIITRKPLKEQKEKEVLEGISVYKVPFYPFYPFHAWLLTLSINRLFSSLESNFDIVHLHSPMPLPIRTSLPLLTTVHTPMRIDARYHEILGVRSLLEKIQSCTVYPLMESTLFKISEKLTAVSENVALELEEYGVDSSSVEIVRNGVNSSSFFPVEFEEKKEEYVLYTGVLRARKGLFDFIQCAKYVNEIRPDTKFLICGKGSFRGNLENTVREMKLEKHVVFLGYLNRKDLISTFQNATIQVVPSHYEGMPTALLEAMSCGLPVVATDIGGNNEVINSGKNGFLVPPKSPRVMAATVLSLLNDALLRKKVGRAARITIEKRYTWDKVTNKILDCYKSIL